jgi:hypothetical protein
MSVGLLPGMTTYQNQIAADTSGMGAAGAALVNPSTAGGNAALNYSISANATVGGTIIMFALLWFGMVAAYHYLDKA